jgi:hypothetical protein
MDGSQFDRITRQLSSRRTAISGVLAGLLLPLEASARSKKGKDQQRKSKGKSKDKQRVSAQDSCWRAGACIPKKGANVSQCDLANYSPNATLDCTGCNISRANLRGANLSGANLSRANLSGSCLVDANLSGATVTNTTNLYNAIFCRTTMPDGSLNNSGCGSGTACCPTCDAAHLCTSGCCNGLTCGACPAGLTCGGGNPGIPGICGCTPATCESLGDVCGPNVPDGCGGTLSCGPCEPETCDNGPCPGDCRCLKLVDGATLCYSSGVVPRCRPCSSAADCIGDEPYCFTSIVNPDGEIVLPDFYCSSQAAVCINVTPC